METKIRSMVAILASTSLPVAFSSVSDLTRRHWQRAAKYTQLLFLHFLHHCLTAYAAILTLLPSKHCWDVKVVEDTDCAAPELLRGAAPGSFETP